MLLSAGTLKTAWLSVMPQSELSNELAKSGKKRPEADSGEKRPKERPFSGGNRPIFAADPTRVASSEGGLAERNDLRASQAEANSLSGNC
jgi:hypothetical protein